jgi:hypothetical protein
MFWRKDAPADAATPPAPGSTTPAPIDPDAEKQRIAKLTANKPITIRREGKTRIKLPGL